MRRVTITLLIAIVLAISASRAWPPAPFNQRLTQIQFAALPTIDPSLKQAPIDIQALLLNYADDPVLLLKAQAALMASPSTATSLFRYYGHDPAFQHILRRYGDSVLAPIDYFVSHQITTLELQQQTSETIERLKQHILALFSTANTGPETTKKEIANSETASSEPLSAEQRGQFAIAFIAADGHRFLSQFTTDSHGNIHWITTQRVLDGIGSFFASGIRNLEIKQKTEEPTTFSDYGWAALDSLVIALPALAAVSRVAKAEKLTLAGTRSAKPMVLSKTQSLTKSTKAGAAKGLRLIRKHPIKTLAAAGTIAVFHPSLINSFLDSVANLIGVPAFALKFTAWTLLLFPLLYLGLTLVRWLRRWLVAGLRIKYT